MRMRKIKLYIAISLNGKIANEDGGVDWLESIPNPEKIDYEYAKFYESIDTTIQGYKTYDQIIGWGIDFPYADKTNYVLTRKQKLLNTKYVEFVSENHIDFINKLKRIIAIITIRLLSKKQYLDRLLQPIKNFPHLITYFFV